MKARLQKLIAEAGICSRRKAEKMIEDGTVVLNGEIARLGQSADLEKDEVYVDGRILKPEKKVYLMLHKPKGFITTSSDPYGRRSVTELVHVQQRVFSVGRLDKDTSGLLLMTNDGDWANKVMHPRYEVKKTYLATLDKQIQGKDLERLNEGVILDRKKIKALAKRLSNKKVRITVHTGMNKEVKRLFKSLGYWVRELKRTEVGPLKLDVKEGKFRHLVPSEVKKFTQ